MARIKGMRKAKRQKRGSASIGRKGHGRTILRFLLCMLVFALLCVPAVFVNTLIGYLPALFFALLVGLSFAYCRLCSRSFAFDDLAEAASCVRGGTVDVRLRVHNGSVLYVPAVDVDFSVKDLFGNVTESDRATIALNPRSSEDFAFALRFGHIGQFDVGLRRLIVHDPLGLFETEIPADSACSIAVTPRLHEVDDIPLSDAAVKQVSEALRPSSLPGSDYCGVRDYVPGDPMKLIHWKLSARNTSYFTKLFEEQSDPSLDIYLDLTAPDYDPETLMDIYDAAIETALSLEAHAHEKGLDTRLLYLGEEGKAQQFVLSPGSDFRDLIQRLPLVSQASSEPFEQLVHKNATTLQAADNIAICTANCTSGMAEALARVRSTQRTVLMFALVPTGIADQERANLLGSLRTLQNAGVYGYAVDAGDGRP